MTFESDALVDRRRLRRRLTLWRLLAIGLAVAAVIGAALTAVGAGGSGGRQIARIDISGTILDDRPRLEMLQKLAKSRNVEAVLVHINSPGGTTAGGEALFEGLRELAEKKPVVGVMGTMATSAAFITGLATDHIVARGNTVTGSVGVIFQWPEVSQALDKLGIKMNEVKSGSLKAVPSMFQPVDEQGRQLANEMVAESQRWFVGLVANRRKIDPATVPGLLQGRIFSGRQALEHKLIDAIGGEREAVKWLEEKRNVPRNLRVVDWKPERDRSFSLTGAASKAAASVVAQSARELVGDAAGQSTAISRLMLDGLVSVWHVSPN